MSNNNKKNNNMFRYLVWASPQTKTAAEKKVGFKTFFKKARPFLNWYDFFEREKLEKKSP